MPSCRLPIRSLLPSRSSVVSSGPSHRSPWRRAVQRYGTALDDARRDETIPPNELDLSKLTSESSYLDFLLGPRDGELPIAAPQNDTELQDSDTRRASPPRKRTRQQRMADLRAPQTQHGKGQQRLPIPLQPETVSLKQEEASTARKTKTRSRKISHLERRRIVACLTARKWLHDARSRGLRVRTKSVAIRSAGGLSGGFSSIWNVQFARLQRHYDKTLGEYMSPRNALVLDPNAATWAQRVMEDPDGNISMALGRLAGFSTQKRNYYWGQVALWLLYHEPDNMVNFLRGTHIYPYPPVTCVDDSLRYLAMHFSHQSDTTQLQSLAELFPLLADREQRGCLIVDGSFFHLLIPHCSHEQINEMYRAVKVHHVKVDWLNFLRFVTHFAKSGHFEQALDALLEAKKANAVLDSFAFRSNCATLLRYSIRQPAGLRVCLRIIDNLVKIGVTLNVQLCNIVMLNAVEAGDLNTAFSIYRSLVEHGIEADSYTYAVLLKGCKSAIDDADTLNATIRSAIEHVNLMQEPVVSTEIIHCLALHHKKHSPGRAFETVADAFAQLFDASPLKRLGLLSTRQAAPDKMQPSLQAMAIMLTMYLDHIFERSRSNAQAYELYKRFRMLVDCRAKPFLSMTETDHISNCFLMTFIKTKKGLLYAAEVIKDMQRESEHQCKPTQQSWSIFLHGFTRHGQMKLAEQVLNYMRSKNIEPSEVTWNTLATGYASAQDVEGTLDVLRRMEVDSVTWDEWTMAGLRKLRDQDTLRRELERNREVPQLDFTSDIKDSLGRRINTFGEVPRRMEQRRVAVDESFVADSPSELAESGAQTYTPFS